MVVSLAFFFYIFEIFSRFKNDAQAFLLTGSIINSSVYKIIIQFVILVRYFFLYGNNFIFVVLVLWCMCNVYFSFVFYEYCAIIIIIIFLLHYRVFECVSRIILDFFSLELFLVFFFSK